MPPKDKEGNRIYKAGHYQKYREGILKRSAIKRATPEDKKRVTAYMKEYRARPGFNERRKEWLTQRKKDPKIRAKLKNDWLRREYGITLDYFESMLSKQNGGCAICGGTGWGKGGPNVDHDHKTGKVRGLLCACCNMSIGGLGDDPKIVRRAAEYLERSRDDE